MLNRSWLRKRSLWRAQTFSPRLIWPSVSCRAKVPALPARHRLPVPKRIPLKLKRLVKAVRDQILKALVPLASWALNLAVPVVPAFVWSGLLTAILNGDITLDHLSAFLA